MTDFDSSMCMITDNVCISIHGQNGQWELSVHAFTYTEDENGQYVNHSVGQPEQTFKTPYEAGVVCWNDWFVPVFLKAVGEQYGFHESMDAMRHAIENWGIDFKMWIARWENDRLERGIKSW